MSFGKRFAVVLGLILLYICCIAFQSFRTIVSDGDKYRALVGKLNRENQVIPQVRGFIFSDNDEMLAGSLPEYDIYLDFRSTTHPNEKGEINIPADTINKYFSPSGEGSMALAKIAPQRTAAQWSALIQEGYTKRNGHLLIIRALSYTGYKELRQMPYFNKQRYRNGLTRDERAHRYRPFGDTRMAARTIGSVYARKDTAGRIGSGRGGIELAYDSLLRGVPGRGYRQSIRRRMIDIIESEPVNGANVHTTLNVEMQDILDRALGKRILELHADGGWAAVMDVHTGQIKAISNLHRTGDSAVVEDYNHLVEDLYDPGSTFKTVSYMVLLDNDKITPETIVNTGNTAQNPSDWNCHGKHIRDDHPVGTVTAEEAIVQSSNIAVAKLTCQAYESNPDAYLAGIEKIGMMNDLALNCDFPGAQAPRKRSTKEKTWSKVSLGQISYGYENRIPGLYMLNFYNAIANGGKLMRPYIVREVEKDGKVLYEREPEVVNKNICSPKTLEAVRHALRGVVEHGTAKSINSKRVTIAGKTGTAQRYANGNYDYGNGHYVSFAGFFPFEDPQYSMIVVIDVRPPYPGRPGGGYMAGPVFRQFAEEIYALHCEKSLHDVTPDTLHRRLPEVKRGPQKDTEYLLSKLRLDSLNFKPSELDGVKEIIPNVVGMGAEDALYALETRGLRVQMSGMGRVVRQSLAAGSPAVKGSSIELTLKN